MRGVLQVHMALLCLVLVFGCEDPRADMGDQLKQNPYDYTPFYANGSSARPLVAGVVPRDDASVPGVPYVQSQSTGRAGIEDVAVASQTIPFPITRDILTRGQGQYGIYCAVCHGRLGNGEGMIVQRGMVRPPSFHVPRLIDAPDGHYYNVISHGFGAMFSYNDRIVPNDRWAIVAYIRLLQAAPEFAKDKITDADRRAFIAHGDAPTGGKR
jgi:mono/diheme cytochrome c family protein